MPIYSGSQFIGNYPDFPNRINQRIPAQVRRYYVKTAPTVEPVTVDELKLFARIDGSEEDALLTELISYARELVEKATNRALITQTIILALDNWYRDKQEIPVGPVQSIVEIRELDEDGSDITYSSDNYYLDQHKDPAQVVIKSGATTPLTELRRVAGYEIEYVAGYGSAGSSVPAPLRLAIKALATDLYEKRLPESGDIPVNIMTMVEPYRVVFI